MEIAGRPFPISVEFLDDLDRHDAGGDIRHLARPLLVAHAVDDEIVGIAQGERIFELARQPKAFIPLLDTDHLLTDRAGTRQALATLAQWFDRTL